MNQPMILLLAIIICTAGSKWDCIRPPTNPSEGNVACTHNGGRQRQGEDLQEGGDPLQKPQGLATSGLLGFRKISTTDITVSWDKECFDYDAYYKVEVLTDQLCTKDDYHCTESSCELEFSAMGCSFSLNPCTEVAYTITGKANSNTSSRNTTTAPLFNEEDWKLYQSTLNSSTGVLHAMWGPPEVTNTHATCATSPSVIAQCKKIGIPLYGTIGVGFLFPDPTIVATQDLDLGQCEAGEVKLTVTYNTLLTPPRILVNTETISPSVTFYYAPPGTPTVSTTTDGPTIDSTTTDGSRNVYPQNVVLYSSIAILFGILTFNY